MASSDDRADLLVSGRLQTGAGAATHSRLEKRRGLRAPPASPPVLQIYPIETYIAEELHAYTMPLACTNTRVKGLPDIALLAGIRSLQTERLRAALEQTLTHRATHALPSATPDPPASWSVPYQQMARENELPWPTLEGLTAAAAAFLDPMLARGARIWHPARWTWE